MKTRNKKKKWRKDDQEKKINWLGHRHGISHILTYDYTKTHQREKRRIIILTNKKKHYITLKQLKTKRPIEMKENGK